MKSLFSHAGHTKCMLLSLTAELPEKSTDLPQATAPSAHRAARAPKLALFLGRLTGVRPEAGHREQLGGQK